MLNSCFGFHIGYLDQSPGSVIRDFFHRFKVMRPQHYGGEENPHEAIKIIEHYGLGFHLGNCIKYLLRAGKKGNEIEDLEKARWYLDRQIENLKNK